MGEGHGPARQDSAEREGHAMMLRHGAFGPASRADVRASGPRRSSGRFTAGFTAAEMLVATAIAAVIVGAAAAAFSTITRWQRQYTEVANVRLPSGALNNFYGVSGTSTSAYMAPNLGSVARAESMREKFFADTAQAIA